MYFSHVTPAGATLTDRARRAGYAKSRCSWRVGEVLAWGVGTRSTAAATVERVDGQPGAPAHPRLAPLLEIGIGMVGRHAVDAQYPAGVTAAAVLGRRHC